MPYTRERANSVLPELREILAVLQKAFDLALKHEHTVEDVKPGNGGGPALKDFFDASQTISRGLKWIADQGIILRDVNQGLCDFPSQMDGEDIFLCWKLGEDSVDFWHDLESGFSGRQPIE